MSLSLVTTGEAAIVQAVADLHTGQLDIYLAEGSSPVAVMRSKTTVDEKAAENKAITAGSKLCEAAKCKKTTASTAVGFAMATPVHGNTSAAEAKANFTAATAKRRFEPAPIVRHSRLSDNLTSSFPAHHASDYCFLLHAWGQSGGCHPMSRSRHSPCQGVKASP